MNNRILYLNFIWLLISCNYKTNNIDKLNSNEIIELTNSVVKDSIRQYYSKYLSNGNGVITIRIIRNRDTTVYIVSSILSSYGLEKNQLFFYSKVDKIPILILTGLEDELILDSSYFEFVKKSCYPYLEEIPIPFNPVVWEIKTKSQKYVGSKVLN